MSMPGKSGNTVVRRGGLACHCVGRGPRRPEFDQSSSDTAVPGVVPASEQARLPAYSGDFSDGDPPVAGVGGAGKCRSRTVWPRHRLLSRIFEQAADQLRLVGSTWRTERATTCSRAGSSAWTNIGTLDSSHLPVGGTPSSPTQRLEGFLHHRDGVTMHILNRVRKRRLDLVLKVMEHYDAIRGRRQPGPVGRGRRAVLRRSDASDGGVR